MTVAQVMAGGPYDSSVVPMIPQACRHPADRGSDRCWGGPRHMLTVTNRRRPERLPAYWPAGLHPQVLDQLGRETPYLICDLRTLRDRYARLVTAFPTVRMFYAVKCNPAPEVLQALAQVGASFEVAS